MENAFDVEFRERLRALFSGARDVVFLDLETTGTSPMRGDLITQAAYTAFFGGHLALQGSRVLDWSAGGGPLEHAGVYRERVEEICAKFASRGGVYQVPWERVLAEGAPAEEALAEMLGVLTAADAGGAWLAGHNVFSFDLPFLREAFARAGVRGDWRFPPDRVIDTGLVEKWRLLGHLPPSPGAGAVERWWRECAARRGVKGWGLSSGCAERYGLEGVARAMGAPDGNAHDAVFDTWLSAALWRVLTEGRNHGAGEEERAGRGPETGESVVAEGAAEGVPRPAGLRDGPV